jgi:uncharacterized membrane protein
MPESQMPVDKGEVVAEYTELQEIPQEMVPPEVAEEIEEAEDQKREAERQRVSMTEAFVLILVSAVTDALEILADLLIEVPILGQIFWLFVFIVGLIVSGFILIWSFLKGGPSYLLIRRFLITLFGLGLDEATLGALPLRTITVAAIILMTNHDARKKLKQANARLDELLKSA